MSLVGFARTSRYSARIYGRDCLLSFFKTHNLVVNLSQRDFGRAVANSLHGRLSRTGFNASPCNRFWREHSVLQRNFSVASFCCSFFKTHNQKQNLRHGDFVWAVAISWPGDEVGRDASFFQNSSFCGDSSRSSNELPTRLVGSFFLDRPIPRGPFFRASISLGRADRLFELSNRLILK